MLYGRVAPGFPLEQLFATARIVMGRRGKAFTEVEEQLYLTSTSRPAWSASGPSRAHDRRGDPWPVAQAARLDRPAAAR